MKKILVISFLLFPRFSFAEGLDYAAGFGGRTLPFGAAVYGEAGYTQLLWGVTLPGYYKYGYIRPGIRVSASGVTYRADLHLDVYPISFLGFRAGYIGAARLADSASSIDCGAIQCDGTLGTTYLKAQGAFGYGPAFAALSARYAGFLPGQSAEPFLDDVGVLVGRAGGDRQLSFEAVAGYNLDETKQLGFYYAGDRFIGTGNSNDLKSVYGRLKSGPWAYTLGLGLYSSTTQALSPSVYAVIHWTGLPLMGL